MTVRHWANSIKQTCHLYTTDGLTGERGCDGAAGGADLSAAVPSDSAHAGMDGTHDEDACVCVCVAVERG
jgi:hypothetical protein